MRIISFARTTPALLAGSKTVTRRAWAPRHAAGFHAGDLVQAWDKGPRSGGRRVGTIRLTMDPFVQSTALATIDPNEYYAEGFGYLSACGAFIDGMRPADLWALWRDEPRDLWVVRFHLVEAADASRQHPD